MRFLLSLLLVAFSTSLIGQFKTYFIEDFELMGTAQPYGDGAIRLTENELNKKGAMWYKNDIDLSEGFNLVFDIYFGCSDGGADGIVFTLHPAMALGEGGKKIGFGGLSPSFGLEMDTYQQFSIGDIHSDHGAFLANGITSHEHFLSEPVPLTPFKTNVENCEWHNFQIKWEPRREVITFFFDGVYRMSRKIDLINVVFKGNANVFWGFTSATGKHRNNHLVKVNRMEFVENNTVNEEDQADLLNGDPYILQKLNYEKAGFELPESLKPELDKLARFYESYPDHTIVVNAFVDENEELALKRAKAIVEYLNIRGVPKSFLMFLGNSDEGKDRVEITMRVIRA